eukprot:3263954-Pleurochrysis_carterae.AAC.1
MQGLRAVITATQSACFFLLLLFLQAASPMPIIPAATSSAAAYSANPPSTIAGSRAALVDSGSTRTASGDRTLFPANRITQRNPSKLPTASLGPSNLSAPSSCAFPQ